jgi:serine/threonine-protein kinase
MEQLLRWRDGTVVGGYKLLQEIAEGGMSTIYKAISPRTQEVVAVKILFPHYAKHKRRLQSLFREKQMEGEIASNLNYPHVIRTYSYGKIGNRYYFVMEYINGVNLKDMIYFGKENSRNRKLDIIKQAAKGLSYIHSHGIIHRDICPKNILLSEKDGVKIIDFGLAIPKSSGYRVFWGRAGTPSYMSPEQIRALEPDERTDIYSFGVTMYEVLAGKPPFRGEDNFAKMQQHLASEPVPLSKRIPDIPIALEEIVSKAMQKEPTDRYRSIDDLLDDLEKIDFRENYRE